MSTSNDVARFAWDRESLIRIGEALDAMSEEGRRAYKDVLTRLFKELPDRGESASATTILSPEAQKIFDELQKMVSDAHATLAPQLGFARTHAEDFNRAAPDWRITEGHILESSVYEYVRENSPQDTPIEEIQAIVALTIKELMKLL